MIVDEAHRSQREPIDGLAWNLREALRGASLIGFSGTPIERTDANTRAVFGDYVWHPDLEEETTKTGLTQVELLCCGWMDTELTRRGHH